MADINFFSSCPLCNSGNIVSLKKYQTAYLTKCRDCSFVFSKRKPTTDELKDHYKKYPAESVISPITISRYEELLQKFEPFRKTNNILDVGCGDGYFLEVAKKQKWNVFGTEFREESIKICSEKGIHMHHGTLSTLQNASGHFDIITSFEVLEHINNPLEEIALFSQLLRSEGAAYITTPNFNSLSRYTLSNKWNVIDYPEHLSYYTIRTLRSLFHRFNFSIIDHSATGISVTRFVQSSHKNKLNNNSANYDETIRQATESNRIFRFGKNILNYILNCTNTGDALKILLKKQS
jgi:2-polyprenyl-3-methyl-5-hydroxy-6-metoxy-1,4-benzoquinol methylase